MKRSTILILLMGAGFLHAQERPFPVRITASNEATAIPFTQVWTMPVHPSLQVGTAFDYTSHGPHHLYQTANLGYTFHQHLYQGAYLSSELGYDYRFNFGLNAKALVGLGYLHTFSTQQEYRFVNGKYEAKADRGNGRLMPSLSLGAGYRLAKDREYSPEVFVLYQSWMEYPYSPGFIPLMTHTNVHLGVTFFLNAKNRSDEK